LFFSSANGKSSSVIGEGSLSLTNDLNLDSVLVVPSLKHNFLFVSQITTTLQCIVIFWPNHSVFKDLKTWKTISYGTRKGKLYYFDVSLINSRTLAHAFSMDGTHEKNKSAVWLWHQRLGYASFGYLKKLFLDLFS